jgi:hypothetical protein
VRLIDRATLPIYSWASELEAGALAQAVNCATCHGRSTTSPSWPMATSATACRIGAVLALDKAVGVQNPDPSSDLVVSHVGAGCGPRSGCDIVGEVCVVTGPHRDLNLADDGW